MKVTLKDRRQPDNNVRAIDYIMEVTYPDGSQRLVVVRVTHRVVSPYFTETQVAFTLPRIVMRRLELAPDDERIDITNTNFERELSLAGFDIGPGVSTYPTAAAL
jgi:hypothetical protein